MTALDRLVAGVRAELDALLPVLAEEVTAAVASRHGLAVPPDVAPVVAALHGLRSVDDPSVERAVLGALDHPIEGALMAGKMEHDTETERPPEPSETTTHPAEDHDWLDDCPRTDVEPLRGFTLPAVDTDVTTLMEAAAEVHLGRFYAKAAVGAYDRLMDGRLEADLLCCDEEERAKVAQGLYCVGGDARRYSTLASSIGTDVLGHNQRNELTSGWNHFTRLFSGAMATDEDGDWDRARWAAADLREVMACHVRTAYYLRVNEALEILGRTRRVVDMLGPTLDVLTRYTGYDCAAIRNAFADHRKIVLSLGFIAGGERPEAADRWAVLTKSA